MYAVVNVVINSKVTIMKQTLYNPYRTHTATNSIYHYPLIFVNCNVHVITSADVFTQLSRRHFEFDKIMSSPADLHHILSGTSQERSGPQRLGTCWPVKQHIGIYQNVFTIHVRYICRLYTDHLQNRRGRGEGIMPRGQKFSFKELKH